MKTGYKFLTIGAIIFALIGTTLFALAYHQSSKELPAKYNNGESSVKEIIQQLSQREERAEQFRRVGSASFALCVLLVMILGGTVLKGRRFFKKMGSKCKSISANLQQLCQSTDSLVRIALILGSTYLLLLIAGKLFKALGF